MTGRMRAADRREAIVRAALPLFARKGFARTTTKDLALAAGVSEPLLYKHFPSKEALYEEILDFSCREMDPAVKRLIRLEDSCSTLVHLVYYLMRALLVGQAGTVVDWETRRRLMVHSILEDGEYARLLFKTRFEAFCNKIEACLKAAVSAGEATGEAVTHRNATLFTHHLGAWISLVHLPKPPVVEYRVSADELLEQAVWFALRGMGVRERAIHNYFNPAALALSMPPV